MSVDDTTQTELQVLRKTLAQRTYQDGVELWRKRKEQIKLQRLKEQQEMRKLLESYWPFGKADDMKPRRLNNLRLEGLFPNEDHLNAKRFVGPLNLGRPGGGAPMVTDTGKKVTATREDPLLRFQFGSHDLRRCVDNTFRYKTNRKAQEEYKKELDLQISEKRKKEEERKKAEQELEKRREKEVNIADSQQANALEPIKARSNKPKNLGPIFYPCKNPYAGSKSKKLSPLLAGKENGIELVPLLAKQRRFPLKIHLDSTDVTNERKIHFTSLWNREGSAYLRELSKQMSIKREKLKEMKAEEDRIVQRHFTTYNGFWGRPGHGAPKSATKKQRLDKLLYPQMVPISVH